jgi:hypothetical protein
MRILEVWVGFKNTCGAKEERRLVLRFREKYPPSFGPFSNYLGVPTRIDVHPLFSLKRAYDICAYLSMRVCVSTIVHEDQPLSSYAAKVKPSTNRSEIFLLLCHRYPKRRRENRKCNNKTTTLWQTNHDCSLIDVVRFA